ncbi:MAG: phage portal protein [Oscillospiraceae bacterium]|jgi:HK97 family phage portal protein|nr:phage portal protein [Oscillospiraceae bacterium]
MGFLNLFRSNFFKQNNESNNKQNNKIENKAIPVDSNFASLFGGLSEIGISKAMNIPAFASSINQICEAVAMIPIKLYKFEETQKIKFTKEVTDDDRTTLLNDDTGDTLNGAEFKRAMVRDYLVFGNAYAFINRARNVTTQVDENVSENISEKINKNKNKRNRIKTVNYSGIKSINYVATQNISILSNIDPIFKDYNITVQGKQYKPFEFLKILRNTQDGATGKGILSENKELLSTAYSILNYQQNLVEKNGNKKGFIKANTRLSKESMDAIRTSVEQLYNDSERNIIVLNEGLEFKESSNTSVEMQLNENKKSLNNEIKSIFGINQDTTGKIDYFSFFKNAVLPVINEFECSLNRDFLAEKEKDSLYFAFDTKEALKNDPSLKTRFEAYKTALDANIMQIDEIRFMEDLEPLGLNFIKLGLQDVLYNPKTKEVFTPNTGQKVNTERIEYVNEDEMEDKREDENRKNKNIRR